VIWRKIPPEIYFIVGDHIGNTARLGGLGALNARLSDIYVADIGKTLGSQQPLGGLRRNAGDRVFGKADCSDFRRRLRSERSDASTDPGTGKSAHAGNARDTKLTQETASRLSDGHCSLLDALDVAVTPSAHA
jgi:hypothetical protein